MTFKALDASSYGPASFHMHPTSIVKFLPPAYKTLPKQSLSVFSPIFGKHPPSIQGLALYLSSLLTSYRIISWDMIFLFPSFSISFSPLALFPFPIYFVYFLSFFQKNPITSNRHWLPLLFFAKLFERAKWSGRKNIGCGVRGTLG